MSEKKALYLVVIFHLFVAFLYLFTTYSTFASTILMLFYIYALFQKRIDRIIKKIIQVSKDSSND